MKKPFTKILFISCILLVLAASILSCNQYNYTSPGPGVLKFHLGVKNSRTNVIPFGAYNSLNIIVTNFAITRDDGATLIVLDDLNAIRRKSDGDSLNCLGLAARDSQLVLGEVYAPPGTYVNFAQYDNDPVQHDTLLFRFDGAQFTFIPVRDIAPIQRFTFLKPPPNIQVYESKTTIVNVTLDLDSSMVRQSEWFTWVAPMVYISSIQYQ